MFNNKNTSKPLYYWKMKGSLALCVFLKHFLIRGIVDSAGQGWGKDVKEKVKLYEI